ncbi:MAG: alpha-amylase [Marinilabiliaceae bacterium]|nr:alpha-amylase [Marinilabiliaceae bacterium]
MKRTAMITVASLMMLTACNNIKEEKMEKPIIYQIFTRIYGNTNTNRQFDGTIEQNGVGKMADINDAALQSIADMGFTHVWYTGIIRHASTTNYPFMTHPANANVVKGRAGSPYAICDYYDVDPDLAIDVDRRMDEFKALVERSHKHGLKVFIDFVPNHIARNYYSDAQPSRPMLGSNDDKSVSFSTRNNLYYLPGEPFVSPVSDRDTAYHEEPAAVSGNNAFTNAPSVNDWYETVKLNYGVDFNDNQTCYFDPRPDTWGKMRDILLYWIEETHIDGFRCDMAEMVPVEFWQWAIGTITTRYPDVIFMAETYDMNLYRQYINAGFKLLYDKVNFYDIVRGVTEGKTDAREITNIWRRTEGVGRNMVYFLENHDEQRIASDFFAGDAFRGKAAMLLTSFMGEGATMVYYGQELGERGMDNEGFSGSDGRTTIFDYWSADAVSRFVGNDHKYDGAGLTPDEKNLREWYSDILNLEHRYDAFGYGNLYDLMWVNQDSYERGEKLYAFLRYTEKERFIIITNFSEAPCQATIRIPEDALKLMGYNNINEKLIFTDMLGNAGTVAPVTTETVKETGVIATIPAYDGIVLKF